MRPSPQAVGDVRAALVLLAEVIDTHPPHVQVWLRPIADEVAHTRFRVDGVLRQAEHVVAEELWS